MMPEQLEQHVLSTEDCRRMEQAGLDPALVGRAVSAMTIFGSIIESVRMYLIALEEGQIGLDTPFHRSILASMSAGVAELLEVLRDAGFARRDPKDESNASLLLDGKWREIASPPGDEIESDYGRAYAILGELQEEQP